MSEEIHEVELKIESGWKKVEGWISTAWGKIEAVFQFLDSPAGKFSHKRLIAVAAAILAVRQLVKNDPWGALGCAVVAVILAVISAITKT